MKTTGHIKTPTDRLKSLIYAQKNGYKFAIMDDGLQQKNTPHYTCQSKL